MAKGDSITDIPVFTAMREQAIASTVVALIGILRKISLALTAQEVRAASETRETKASETKAASETRAASETNSNSEIKDLIQDSETKADSVKIRASIKEDMAKMS